MIYNYFTDQFLAKAGKEYYERQYAKLLGIINTINVNVTNGTNTSDDTVLVLPEGATTISKLVGAVNSIPVDKDIMYTEISIGDETLPYVTTLYEVLQALTNDCTAMAAEASLANAYNLSTSVTERVTLFRDYLSSKLNNAYSDVSGYIDAVANDIYSNVAYYQHVTTSAAKDGYEKLTKGGKLADVSDTYTYTGISPASGTATAAGLSAAGAVLADASITAVSMGSRFTRALKKFALWLGIRTGQKIHQSTTDPIDIAILDDTGNFTFNELYTEIAFSASENSLPLISNFLAKSSIKIDTIFGEVIVKKNANSAKPVVSGGDNIAAIASSIRAYLTDNKISWIQNSQSNYRLICNVCNYFGDQTKSYGSIMEALDDADPSYALGSSMVNSIDGLFIKIQEAYNAKNLVALIKLKPLNAAAIINAGLGNPLLNQADGSYYYKRDDINGIIEQLLMSNSLYVTEYSSNADETNAVKGLILSAAFMHWMLDSFYVCANAKTLNGSLYVRVPDKILAVINGISSATNEGFFNILTEFDVTLQTLNSGIGGTYMPDYSSALSRMFDGIMLLRNDSSPEPIFLPYITSDVDWNKASFRLIPDQEHAAKYKAFIERTVYTVTAVTIVATVGVALKRALITTMLASERTINSIVYSSNLQINAETVKTYLLAKRQSAISNFLLRFFNFGAVASMASSVLPSTSRGSDVKLSDQIGDTSSTIVNLIKEVQKLIRS